MTATLLLLQLVAASAVNAAAFAFPFHRSFSPLVPVHGVRSTSGKVLVPAHTELYSGYSFFEPHKLRPHLASDYSPRDFWTLPPDGFPLQKPARETFLFACRPRPKREKALRNYRLTKQQRQTREERAAQRRQQIEIMRARQQLVSPSERNASTTSSTPTSKDPLFESSVAPTAAEEAEARVPSVLRGHLAARINYRLVGGTWRRARGARKFVRIPGAQLATEVFQGLPDEDVAMAIAKAKRQDAGQMDLEAYDESDTQLTPLEGVS